MIHTTSICPTFRYIHTYSSACVRDDVPSSVHGDGVHSVCGHGSHGDGVHSGAHIFPTSNRLSSEDIGCHFHPPS